MLLFLSFLAFISLGLPDGLLGVAWPSMSRSFDRELSRLAVLQIALTFGFFFSSVNAGRLIERCGVSSLLIGSNIAVALALAAYGFLDRWYLVVASTVVLGSGGGAVDAGLNAYAANRFSKEQLTLLHAFYGFGAMLGPLIMRCILAAGGPWQYGYRYNLLLVAGLVVTFILLRKVWYGPGGKGAAAASSKTQGREQTLPQAESRLGVRLGVVLFLVYTGLEVTVGTWSFTLFTEGRGVDPGAAALWLGVYWAALTGSRLFFGLFGRRWSSRRIITVMIIVSTAAGLFYLQPRLPMLSLLSLPVIGFAFGPLFPLFVILTPEIVGEEESSRVIGFQVAAANIGSAAVPFVVGLGVELFSLEAAAAVAFLLTLLLAFIYRIWSAL